ncbi:MULTISPECIES: flagellar hook-basal body protein [unclassified Thermosipho (in: thermotogales)]|uniref:flagellar hook-basal body protein n=1 Tax=unclassified Thermosipho (in: thermotogales) TaxID=2676525 RepID=UPI0009857A8D|nr:MULTISPECIES: flagellar hook-basal body protein [unclassified Thermosipho (in: thermotogales)]MBT1247303.1 flagellar biosynthesis protein FlgF [Thermosipho sp. 1244]OOC47157.1 flagellar basal-body rod protein FlgF [Thermosipho sp. 1223]
MYKGIYLASMGMLADITKLDTLSNNISNAETAGYKSDSLAFKAYFDKNLYSFNPMPQEKKVEIKKIGNFEQALILDQVKTNLSQGVIEHTGNALDFAIDGEGFFVLENNGKRLYTRAGNFKVNDEGFLVNYDGAYVLGKDGQKLKTDDNLIEKILVVDLENPKKIGYTFFEGQEKAKKNFRILQGYIEKSNVNIVREMVKMIEATRHYETLSKAVTVHDELLNKSINSAGNLK